MKLVVIFLTLFCVIGLLWRIVGLWRRKAEVAEFAAVRMAESDEECKWYCTWP